VDISGILMKELETVKKLVRRQSTGINYFLGQMKFKKVVSPDIQEIEEEKQTRRGSGVFSHRKYHDSEEDSRSQRLKLGDNDTISIPLN
jgi:hypothetical protein